MAKQPIQPLNEERQFHPQELFFSWTDTKGRILFGNEVFTRISAFQEHELLGAPHNIIRHPHMPRCVFKLLWDTIGAGETIAAYVKNLAKDGRYYWVLAVVTPCEGGYLSVRLKPTSPVFHAVEQIYHDVLAAEREAEDAGADRAAQMAAGARRVAEALRGLGFADYVSFMRQALMVEMQARGEPIQGRTQRPPTGTLETTFLGVVKLLDGWFTSLDRLNKLQQGLRETSSELHEVAATLHFESLNANIVASRSGAQAEVLGAVAKELGAVSASATHTIKRLIDGVGPMAGAVGGAVFGVAVARLEAEVAASFAQEIADRGGIHTCARSRETLRVVTGALVTLSGEMLSHLELLARGIDTLDTLASGSMRDMCEMGFVQFAGKKEAASLRSSGFETIFRAIGERVAQGVAVCRQLRDDIATCRSQVEGFLASRGELVGQLGTAATATAPSGAKV